MSELNLSLHRRQTEALLSDANEMLYGGAAGGGKSHLMRVASILWCSEIPGLQIYLFRRLSDDLQKNHMNGPGSYPELLAPLLHSKHVKYNGSERYFKFWNGARIWLCHCQHEKDMFKYQGAEIHVLLIDELTHFSEVIYRFLRGRCRLGGLRVPEKYKGKFPRILNGSNPGGVGHTFVRRMFVNGISPMAIRDMPKEEGGMRRQYVPAKLDDNPTLADNDPSYLLRLEGLGNKALVKAMRDGDWNIVAGGALDDVWDESLLRIPRFKVPQGWRVDRSMDWGSAKPFSVGWWAEADGTEAKLPDGSIFCPVKGSIIRIMEWYGTPELGTNAGLKLGSETVAEGIKLREAQMRHAGWVSGEINPGPADNSITKVEDDDSDSIARKMEKKGIKWAPSDKSPGSRINGLQLLRDRLMATKTGEGKAIYFTDNCESIFALLPVLPRDINNPEDVDSSAEDHNYDEVRYRVLSDAKKFAFSIKVQHPT
jgi:hypothetical protein